MAAMPDDTAPPTDAPGSPIDLSVVAPAHNEEDNVRDLVEQIERALRPTGLRFEIIIVDDGSTDATRQRVIDMIAARPFIRCIAMTNTPPGKGNGQSAAFCAGLRAARGRLIAMLDADLQNDPADFPLMLDLMRTTGCDMVQGDRSHARKDNIVRRAGSIVGRKVRLWLLGDSIRDTGCAARVFKREIAAQLPLQFKGMHRFVPVMARHLGYTVVEMPVRHHPRSAGTTKYGMGILPRALPGLIDLFAVRWMRSRRRPVSSVEMSVNENPGVHLVSGSGAPGAAEIQIAARQPRSSETSAAGARA